MTTASAASSQRVFTVWWKDLDRWVVPSNLFLRGVLPRGWKRVRLRELLRQCDARVKAQPGREYKMAGVRWYGEGVFHRETVRGEDMSASYVTPLVPGALIYNRLFAWKGSFAVVPPDLDDCFVSSEFPQFIVDSKRLMPEYVYLFCTRETTVHAVNAASTGSAAVSRNRFKEEQFLNFEIPLPPLGEQTAIVSRWRDAKLQMAAATSRIAAKNAEIEERFLTDLGLNASERPTLPKSFGVWWKDFLRWGVNYNQQRQTGLDIAQGKFPVVQLGSILDLVQYGTSEKASGAALGTPVLRIGNIKDRALDLSDLKYVKLPPDTRESLLLREGDIVIIRTSGSRDLVGTCAVFHGTEDFVFASYLIRLRVALDKADSEFISWFINSPLGRQQVDAVSRQIMQNNINSEELRGLHIPLPPMSVQREIVARVQEGRAEIARERAAAALLKSRTETEVNAFVSGANRISTR